MNSSDIVDLIAGLFARRGAQAYLGEPVTVAEHMLQTAALAQAEGAPDTWLSPRSCTTSAISQANSADIRRRILSTGGMTRPVRLSGWRVCFRLPSPNASVCMWRPSAIFAPSSPDIATRCRRLRSTVSRLQGGPMTPAGIDAFRRLPCYRDAVQVRRWDDAAKVAGAPTPGFHAFRPMLARMVAGA